MSVIWSGITSSGSVVPVQVTEEGKVVATTDSAPGGVGVESWASIEKTTSNGPCTILSSYNVASVTRTKVGRYDVVFQTPMTKESYCINAAAGQPVSEDYPRVLSYYDVSSSGFSLMIRASGGDTKGSDNDFCFSINSGGGFLPKAFSDY